MVTTSLKNANVGERWKDREGTVWKVSGVNTKNTPPLIFFERVVKDCLAAPMDKAAFNMDRGWQKVSGTQLPA